MQEEATWSEEGSEWETDEDAGMADAAGDHAAAPACGAGGHAHDHHPQAAGDGAAEAAPTSGVDAGYIHIFLLKYVCPQPGCYGTLAPAAPGADVYACNMCGAARTEAEFLAELEAAD